MGYLHLLAIVNIAAMNIGVQILLSNFENILRSGIARQVLLLKISTCNNYVSWFFKNQDHQIQSLNFLTAKQLFYSFSLYALKAQVKNKSTFHAYDGKVNLPTMPGLTNFPLAKCITL